MKLVKSKGNGKYTLTFEIEPHEAAMVKLWEIWGSEKLVDFVDALVNMTKPKDSPFDDLLGAFRRKKAQFNTNDPFEHQSAGSGQRQQFDPNFGSFSREELNEFLRRQGGTGAGFLGTFNSGTGFVPPNSEPDWAKTLGVKASADRDEIKARYRTLAKENHPDRGGDPAKFAKITEAYNQAMAVKQ